MKTLETKRLFMNNRNNIPVRVVVKGDVAFTCDNEEDFKKSVTLNFPKEQAEQLINGFGISITDRIIILN